MSLFDSPKEALNRMDTQDLERLLQAKVFRSDVTAFCEELLSQKREQATASVGLRVNSSGDIPPVQWGEFIGDPRHAPYYGTAGCAFFLLTLFLERGGQGLAYIAGGLFGFAFAYNALTLAALALTGRLRTSFQVAAVGVFFVALGRFLEIDLAAISVPHFLHDVLASDGLISLIVIYSFLAYVVYRVGKMARGYLLKFRSMIILVSASAFMATLFSENTKDWVATYYFLTSVLLSMLFLAGCLARKSR